MICFTVVTNRATYRNRSDTALLLSHGVYTPLQEELAMNLRVLWRYFQERLRAGELYRFQGRDPRTNQLIGRGYPSPILVVRNQE